MNIKANLKYVLTGSIAFLAIYMFVAAKPMGSDIYFEPAWTTNLENTQDPGETAPKTPPEAFKQAGVEAFMLGERYGFFTADGKILSSYATPNRVSATPVAWATYPEDARDTIVRTPDGSPRMTVSGSGFVHLDGDRTFLFLPGGDAVSQYGEGGRLLWTREHIAPITAFNSSPAGTVMGYADGYLACVAPDGTERFGFYPGGSDREVIFGAALSEDGKLTACVSGIDRQRFILVRASGGQHKIIYHTYLKGNLRRQAFVDFEKGGNFAFFESDGRLGIFDCKKNEASGIPVYGEVVAAGECPGAALFMVLVKNGSRYTLSAIERPDHLVASVNFNANDAFLIQREGAIYLGTDGSISRIDIRGLK
ncbi:MAG TPA: hypothetical protein PKO22_01820 [Treponemataceae bacterium]|nr:hypothetical protein [Treponemataceae bacterium]